ncbi:MAG: hypothetical protein JNJ46_09160 [Myxococcales bacterium]|nr:hypothetical protein [Myxococcales bacterium]
MSRGALGLLWLASLWLLSGCQDRSSPASACQALLRAIAEGDAEGVFETLTQPTQWALYSVQKNHARMWALVQADYPQKEQSAAQSRLYAADAHDGRELFSDLYEERYAAGFAARLGTGPIRTETVSTTEALCRRENHSGPPFRLARDSSFRFGLQELAAEWEQAQLRATHDLATVEKNAAIYRTAQRPATSPAASRSFAPP